jgi:hypothetical protein
LIDPNRSDFLTFNWTIPQTWGARVLGSKLHCVGNEEMKIGQEEEREETRKHFGGLYLEGK